MRTMMVFWYTTYALRNWDRRASELLILLYSICVSYSVYSRVQKDWIRSFKVRTSCLADTLIFFYIQRIESPMSHFPRAYVVLQKSLIVSICHASELVKRDSVTSNESELSHWIPYPAKCRTTYKFYLRKTKNTVNISRTESVSMLYFLFF